MRNLSILGLFCVLLLAACGQPFDPYPYEPKGHGVFHIDGNVWEFGVDGCTFQESGKLYVTGRVLAGSDSEYIGVRITRSLAEDGTFQERFRFEEGRRGGPYDWSYRFDSHDKDKPKYGGDQAKLKIDEPAQLVTAEGIFSVGRRDGELDFSAAPGAMAIACEKDDVCELQDDRNNDSLPSSICRKVTAEYRCPCIGESSCGGGELYTVSRKVESCAVAPSCTTVCNQVIGNDQCDRTKGCRIRHCRMKCPI